MPDSRGVIFTGEPDLGHLYTTLRRRFREAQGRLNIVMAARADRVVQVVAGLPNVLKGTLA